MEDLSRRREVAGALAAAFLAGPWTREAMIRRGAGVLRPQPRWMRGVVRDVLALYHRPPADRPRELAALIERQIPLEKAPHVRRWMRFEPQMARARWPVPELASPGDLAAWLGEDDAQLAWLADVRGRERDVADERLRHYRYTWLPRPAAPPRLIEAPKPRLKAIQRRILHEILDHIPAHDAAHGFVRGRSARTHAALHTGRAVVIRLDLEDFFACVTAARVYGIFRTAGYPEAVAHTLTALCTNVVPRAVWDALPSPQAYDPRRHRLGRRLAAPHLPQGAPTSPALASLAAYRLDVRLRGVGSALALTLLALRRRHHVLRRAPAVRRWPDRSRRSRARKASASGRARRACARGVRASSSRARSSTTASTCRAATTTGSRPCSTTPPATARRWRTAPACPTSARTLRAASPGSRRCTPRAARGYGRASTRSAGDGVSPRAPRRRPPAPSHAP